MAYRIVACIFALLLLAGCGTASEAELFRVPALPAEFAEFNDQLNVIRAGGEEFTAPISGLNRQSVQLMDLDNDGVDEGIAFAKSKNAAAPACMYVFKKIEDTYQVLGKIEGAGNIVESVSYVDIMGNGNYDVIIGWGLEDNSARTLTAYEITSDGMNKLLEAPYLYYICADMDSDGISDLNVVMPDEQNKSPELAMYSQTMSELRFHTSVPLSRGINEIRKIRSGSAAEGMPAIFIDSTFGENQFVTDIILYKNDQFINATCDEKIGASEITRRSFSVSCEDADSDGVIEVPYPEAFPGYENARLGQMIYGITWRRCDSSGTLYDALYSYHDYADAWQMTLPMKWKGRITVERLTHDRGAMFYGVDKDGKRTHLFSVYALTGESRYEKAAYSGRFQLAEKKNVIYAASVKTEKYLGVKLNEETLREMFRVRDTEWSSGEVVS